MARRRKGRPVTGWLLIDKPSGIGSTDVVNRARRALDARKAGHAGTLDPLATGLLAVAFGEATKTIPAASDGRKGYRFSVRWGEARDTDDAEGAVVETSDARPSDEAIRAALPAFTGDIMQVPPVYSAVKVQGERAYDLARDGETPELAARPLFVERLELVGRPDPDHAAFEMVCGRGGYVRAIARDLGRALGSPAHVGALRRIFADPFDVSEAVPLETLEDPAAAEAALRPLESGLAGLPEVRVSELGAAAIRQGRPGEATLAPADIVWGEEAWASRDGRAVALGRWTGGALTPSRVFPAA